VVVCLERGADLHTAQLMPLPLTVSCFSEIQIGFTILVPACPGSPGQRAVKRVCVCVRLLVFNAYWHDAHTASVPLLKWINKHRMARTRACTTTPTVTS